MDLLGFDFVASALPAHLKCIRSALPSQNPRNLITSMSTPSILALEHMNVKGTETQRVFVKGDVSRIEILDPLTD